MKIPLAGVIGCPVGHSRSPILHGTWLRQYGLAGHYVPLHVEADDLADMLRAMPRMGFVGANVTVPHKEAALALADDVTETARRIGAANTLTFGADGRIQADNTDAYGFMANLRQNAPGWQPSGGPALVLGAGGAARAVIVALQDAGVPQIYLTNRTTARADALAAEFGVNTLPWQDRERLLPQMACLVNTTSLGMRGQPDLEIDLTTLPASALVTDIVYAPLKTPLLAQARAQGCAVVDGLGMLLHQAVPGFERWFGTRPEVTDALRAAVLA
ncbi:MAG: shikimate dehydrogenase AroE [Roseibaca calidilacus]|uniref:Shikimate dehydrogenase (NADP(+)) n=1 Tax=Roseibaca calidilacus TaxID=1666912 RepID=A0A0P7WJX5_9RHOB|nr:shikimate dehydrogenase [Roseibaca calidilacus]KPP90986.1 MAG: shikimate dehydrogenase AroE [Roseibaca calidilacus]CUX83925.1 shikimate dehydrogenase [Roseibaca calidilacus]